MPQTKQLMTTSSLSEGCKSYQLVALMSLYTKEPKHHGTERSHTTNLCPMRQQSHMVKTQNMINKKETTAAKKMTRKKTNMNTPNKKSSYSRWNYPVQGQSNMGIAEYMAI